MSLKYNINLIHSNIKEFYKETLEDYKRNNDFAFFDEENIYNQDLDSSRFQGKNNPTADKLFFQGVKIMTEIHENKTRELHEKYDLIFYGFLKEKSEEFDKIKNLAERYSKSTELRKFNGNRGSKHFIYINRTFFGLYNLMFDLKAKNIKINNYKTFS